MYTAEILTLLIWPAIIAVSYFAGAYLAKKVK